MGLADDPCCAVAGAGLLDTDVQEDLGEGGFCRAGLLGWRAFPKALYKQPG